MTRLSAADKQRAYRDRQRTASEPVPRYCKAVIEWDARVQTPTSGRLAVLAQDIATAYEHRDVLRVKSVVELLGGPRPAIGKPVVSIAQAALERAIVEIADPKVSERSIRAGLAHAKRLSLARVERSHSDVRADQLYMVRLLTSARPPAYLVEGTPESDAYDRGEPREVWDTGRTLDLPVKDDEDES
jgi:hypothetical protein